MEGNEWAKASGDKVLEGHYPVRVTVDRWLGSIGLIWLIFFLSILWTAFFTQSAAGSAQILKSSPGNESAIQGKEQN